MSERKSQILVVLLTLLCAGLCAGYLLWSERNAGTVTRAEGEVYTVSVRPVQEEPEGEEITLPEEETVEFPIHINTADSAALQALPGIGEKRAEAILEYREANGPFSSVDDLTQVSGIGEGILGQIRELVTVDDE